MSIDIMRNSCLRFIYFENRVTNYVDYFAKVGKKNLKTWVGPFLNLFGMEMQYTIFYAHVHACRISYTDED